MSDERNLVSIFVECDTCRAKPGTPQLCRGCLMNRATIDAAFKRQQRIADRLHALLSENNRINAQVSAWRHNYRETLTALHDENNQLRATAASLNAQLAAKAAPRNFLEYLTSGRKK